jgi:hypothetical protein
MKKGNWKGVKMYKIGNVVKFDYLGKARWVRIEKIKLGYSIFLPSPNPLVITGWDYEADHPVGGYRSFTVSKIENAELVKSAS